MIFLTDAAGSCLYISYDWTVLTGQAADKALGDAWLQRVHPDDQAVVSNTIKQAARTASEYSLRYRVLGSDDQPRWIASGGIPSVGPPGNTFLGYLGSFTRLADGALEGMTAYGNIGRFVPPPRLPATASNDHLDCIADHLIMAHSLIEGDGAQAALPGLRQALLEVGRALTARVQARPSVN